MRLTVIAVGRLKAGPERDLAARYHSLAGALGRGLGVSALDLAELSESRARRAADRRAEEAEAILGHMSRHVAAGAVLVAYDERGRSDLTSAALAGRFTGWRDGGREAMVIAVGGPDGLDPGVRDRAELVLAFGKATLAHGLVRVLVLEQLYRTLTIVAGHPYHRGDA